MGSKLTRIIQLKTNQFQRKHNEIYKPTFEKLNKSKLQKSQRTFNNFSSIYWGNKIIVKCPFNFLSY